MKIYRTCKECGRPKIPNKYLRCRECYNELNREPDGLWPEERIDEMIEFDTCKKIEKGELD